LASYQERLDRMAADARTAKANMRQAGGHATSPRGEVEVSVGPSGALTGLRLTPAARTLEVDQLAQLILDAAREAHRAASAQVVGIMTEYVGEGPALDAIRDRLPAAAAQPAARTDDEYYAEPEIIQ
jgi:DNA-binding protein YbaB